MRKHSLSGIVFLLHGVDSKKKTKRKILRYTDPVVEKIYE